MSYVSYGITVSDGQKSEFRRAMRNGNPITLRLSNSDLSGSDHFLLTQRQINKIEKSEANGVGCDITFSGTQVKKHRSQGSVGGALDPSLILEGIKSGSEGVANIFGSISSTIQNQQNRKNEKQYLTGEIDAQKAKMNMMAQATKMGMQAQRFENLKKMRDQLGLKWSNDDIMEKVLSGGKVKGGCNCKKGGAVDPQLAGDAIRSGSNAGANVVGNITGLIDNSLEQGFVKKQNDGTYDFIKQMNEGKKNSYNDTALVLKIAGIKGMVKKYGLNWNDDKIMEYAMRGNGLFLHGPKNGKGLFVHGKGGYNITDEQWNKWKEEQGKKGIKGQCRALTPQCTGKTWEELRQGKGSNSGKGMFIQGSGKKKA